MLETVAGGAENLEGMAGMEPVGRLGRPEEVAETILFLCSDAGAKISGQALTIDGNTETLF